MLNQFQAFILGIIQGLTEFLPISSTGHLYLGRHLFHLDEAGIFLDTMLHIGTLLALLVVYKDDIIFLLKNPFSKMTLLLIAGTFPAVVAGLLLGDWFDGLSKTGVTIGWEFLVTGLILWLADGVRKGSKSLNEISIKDALIIGTFQAAAIMPALSRSGLTIAAGLFCKLDRATAAYFSFLLSIPAITGGIVFQMKPIFTGDVERLPITALFVGTLAAAIFGYIAVVWMIDFLKKRSLKIFSIYVWALGTIILFMQITGKF
ncbi:MULTISPECIES: undecaprenyl-diphosphate phosphatase [unclassified Peribacillus]|uniref:undecaprenyl-diphosphate phosphatase n=1 Tax=unclassified Peribacillus TaxID=2675266 RepID=UPI0019133410|nr:MULTISPECIES: undecaprenyl-diphosphate phosphatase [unclassified Peribacillus]MBK5442094.1 undecaprenyl-diphosphate phosphatase [Peribacillus sp. TH24]MBK5463131.1 undecaprenyl-diphosphate phosphatase [Peribacillus sp. TH27]